MGVVNKAHATPSNLPVWTAKDITVQSRCTATWKMMNRSGKTLRSLSRPCLAATVLHWQMVPLREALSTHQLYLPLGASPRMRTQLQHRLLKNAPSSFRPFSDCNPNEIFSAAATVTVFNGKGGGTAKVTGIQYYTSNPICTTDYGQNDTLQYQGGPSGAWKFWGASVTTNASKYDSDANAGCTGLPRVASMGGFAVSAGSTSTTFYLDSASNCQGSWDSFNVGPW